MVWDPAKHAYRTLSPGETLYSVSSTWKLVAGRVEEQCTVARAMERMSQFMAAIARVFRLMDTDVFAFEIRQRERLSLAQEEQILHSVKARQSAEWSRRVREGVRALPPPGPRVYCQGDDE